MPTDDLSAPLGQNVKQQKRRRRLPILRLIAGALTLVVLTFAGWGLLANDPLGGEPMAMIAANAPPKPDAATPPINVVTTLGPRNFNGPTPEQLAVQVMPGNAQPALPPGTQTVTIIDGSTGKRLEVPIPAPKDTPARVDQPLFETSAHGLIPKIGPDGAKPAEAYARAAKTAPDRPDAPRIAIVIGGLGVSAAATQEAIAKLPGPVTLAFLPYGAEVNRAVMRARADGHEVLLQTPMEPFDYPDNDPGPKTLLQSLNAEQNVDRLHWLMSRFQGYVGVANFMGARFTTHEPALAPILLEIGKRGLIYFDDGSAPRSLAGQIAGANSLSFAKADVTLDTVASAAHIDKALAQLEATARERGSAIGIASALPMTIGRIAQWAKAVESRGFVLVPITAIAIKPKSS